jgi:hypothetical protein
MTHTTVSFSITGRVTCEVVSINSVFIKKSEILGQGRGITHFPNQMAEQYAWLQLL